MAICFQHRTRDPSGTKTRSSPVLGDAQVWIPVPKPQQQQTNKKRRKKKVDVWWDCIFLGRTVRGTQTLHPRKPPNPPPPPNIHEL